LTVADTAKYNSTIRIQT
jgi:hypothetical protein